MIGRGEVNAILWGLEGLFCNFFFLVVGSFCNFVGFGSKLGVLYW